MNNILEQQKEKARELIDLELDNLATDCVIENEISIPREQRIAYTNQLQNKVCHLIEATYTAAIEEVVRIAEGMIWTVQSTDEAHRFYQVRDHNLALSDLITAIKQDWDQQAEDLMNGIKQDKV